MVATERKIKNWRIPKGREEILIESGPRNLSVRTYNWLSSQGLERLKDIVIPDTWFTRNLVWTDVFYHQPNFGRKAYRELVQHLFAIGAEPVYVEEDEDSMTGALMR